MIREALEVMGATHNKRKDKPWRLARVKADINEVNFFWFPHEILFIGECKEYLREKGYRDFGVIFTERGTVQLTIVKDLWGPTFVAPTEPEAWAKAVLSVHKGGEG